MVSSRLTTMWSTDGAIKVRFFRVLLLTMFNEEDEAHMKLALNLAEKAASRGEVPVGAIVVRDGEVIGEGYNQPIERHDPSAHAEVCALRNAGAGQNNYRLPGSILYVTLEPCTMCLGLMIHARVGRLVYAATEPRAGAVGGAFNLLETMPYNHRMSVDSGLFADKSAAILKAFFAARRK